MSGIFRLVAWEIDLSSIIECNFGSCDIFGQIYKHRSGSSSSCDVESLSDCSGNFTCISYKVIVLCNGHSYTRNICLLKSVISNKDSRNLSCHNNHRRGVHVCCCYSSDGVCCSRSRSGKCNSNFPCRSCIAIGSMDCSLLVSCQNMLYSRIK